MCLPCSFGMGCDDSKINYYGWEGEHAYHGAPSGVDNTVSTFGGVVSIKFFKDEKRSEWRRINLKRDIHAVLGHSGVTANTAMLYPKTVARREEDPSKFDAALELIKTHVAGIEKALGEDNLEEVGRIMVENHKVLIDLGVSHPKLKALCDAAMEAGALGAKLTGGGMGGFMLALTPTKESQEKVTAALRAAGATSVMLGRIGPWEGQQSGSCQPPQAP